MNYEIIKGIAKQMRCRASDLLALSPQNDPFYADLPHRTEAAEWFAQQWERFQFRHGTHLRRTHYVLMSQEPPVLKSDGEPYLNTTNDWKYLGVASLAARYRGFVPAEAFIDRRNPDPQIYAKTERPSAFGPHAGILHESLDTEYDLPDEVDLPMLYAAGFEAEQEFLVEVWVEKSTVNDIMEPLARRFGFNLITGIGEMSETAARNAVGRAVDAGRPMRILYVSDFDPKGQQMPVSVARKIEWTVAASDVVADITLEPIVLTSEQCEQFGLPRKPIEKRGNGHADKFEARWGAGATELDALEALHPGELRKIVEQEVGRYLDPTLDSRVMNARSEIEGGLTATTLHIHDLYSEQIADFQTRFDQIRQSLADLDSDAADLWERISENLRDESPEITADDVPKPREANPVAEPLYDSSRGYLEQIDFYRAWQGRGGGRDGT